MYYMSSESQTQVMTRTSQADASRSGSKHSALPAMGKTFSSAGAIAQTSNAFTVGVSDLSVFGCTGRLEDQRLEDL